MEWLKSDKEKNKRDLVSKKGSLKEDKKYKRSDALRLSIEAPIDLKCLGTMTLYSFSTNNISTTGVFVECDDTSVYPFLEKLTILECKLFLACLNGDAHKSLEDVSFSSRVMRVIGSEQDEKKQGFGLKIIQISPEDQRIIESLIEKQ